MSTVFTFFFDRDQRERERDKIFDRFARHFSQMYHSSITFALEEFYF